MSVVLVGVDHRATPTKTLESCAINSDDLIAVLEKLQKSDHIAEIVILSTCLRTEIYMDVIRFHGAVHDARATLAELSGQPLDELSNTVFELYDRSAYSHLFRVTAGLESSVIGEPEVLGQVSRVWAVAREANTAKAVLNGLFKRAIEIGKRVRTDTAIARGTTSIGHAAVAMVKERLGELSGKNVLLVGAGEMGTSMAGALTAAKNEVKVKVTNRTYGRAVSLAQSVHGEAAAFESMPALLTDADVVLTSTGSSVPLIDVGMARAAIDGRDGRPLVLVDVAVPADVADDVRELDGVTVLDMTDLNQFAARGRAERAAEVKQVEMLIEEELWRYVSDANARTVVPVLAALRERVESIRDKELARQGKRFDQLDPATAATVDSIINAVVAKLLHEPTVRLKAVGGTPEAERLADAVRYLFDV